ncbi:hypothetical protein Tco_0782294, partial [Tanacetum coccineum]
MGDENPIRTLRDYSKPSHEGYMNTIELPEGNNVLAIGLNVFQQDPSPHRRILLLVSLLNFFHREGLQNSAMTSLCSNNINESRLVSRTYSKKSLIMASIFGSKSKSFMTMSILSQDEPLTNRPVKAISEKLDDTPTHNTVGNPTAQMNFASTNYPTKEELQGKGIKILSKLLSLIYLSQSSLAEQNRNPSSPKRVHFVNSIIILNKEDEAKEEGSMKSSSTKYKDHEMIVESEEEFTEETEEETKEEEEDNPEHFDDFPTMKELGYHKWLLKNPRSPWVKAKIRTGNLNNVDVLS